MLKRWDKLTMFVDNPLIPPDNNHAERALRGPVVGRKNHYGCRVKTRNGGRCAVLYSLRDRNYKISNREPIYYELPTLLSKILWL